MLNTYIRGIVIPEDDEDGEWSPMHMALQCAALDSFQGNQITSE